MAMKKNPIFFSIAALGIALSLEAGAQSDLKKLWDSDPRILPAANNLRNVVATAGLAVVAKEVCSVGDPEPWVAVVGAVEARYLTCVKEDPNWAALKIGLEDEEENARQSGVATDPPMLMFIRAMKARGSRALDDKEAFCGNTPWKLMLDPAHATPEEIAEDKRIAPDGEIEKALEVMLRVRSLGQETSWVNRPCDKEFWPSGFELGK